jgi:hypothetical protein
MKLFIPENTGVSHIRKINLYEENSGLHIYYDFIGTDSLRANLSKKILEIGDVQKRSTNLNADMTGWATQNEEPFKTIADLSYLKVCEISDKFFNRPDLDWFIKSCWGARYIKGDYALLHDHYPATWSLVYYVNAPKGSSHLEFPGSQISIQPTNGLMLIFPGNIEHQVPVCDIDNDRIVVSINFYARINYEA